MKSGVISSRSSIQSKLAYESQLWKKQIWRIQNENIELKKKLDSLVLNLTEKKLLEKLEVFNNLFVIHDSLLNILRSDIQQQLDDA